MTFKCGATDCTFSAQSSRGQTIHRTRCQLWHNLQEKKAALRREKALALESANLSRGFKKRRLDEVVPSFEASVSCDNDNDTCNLEPTITRQSPSPPPPPPLQPPIQPPQNPSPPQLTATGRPRRNYIAPARYRDILPEPVPIIEPLPQPDIEPPTVLRRVTLIVRDRLVTIANSFGLWRDYPRRPTHVPDASVPLDDLANMPLSFTNAPQAPLFSQPPPWPFSNMTIYRLMTWLNSGGNMKSSDEANRLVKDVIMNSDFSAKDLSSFDVHKESTRLDNAIMDASSSPYLQQFSTTSIDIDIPSGKKNVPPTKFSVPGLLYRKITSVIQAAFHDNLAHHFHLSPFKLFHRSPQTEKEERVYGEVYTSDAFLEEHEHIQRRAPVPPDDPECKREKVIAAIMISSDGTHLANFGTAKAWPIYLMLGNLSKYFRALPNLGAMYHLAYIPSLPDSFQDIASKVHAKWDTQKKGIVTHCRRELMHGVWDFLFDDDFLHACKYGMVITCVDGVERRVYPRLFTYSADYPEKVLLATIRDKGICPCPRCLVKKSELDRLGLYRDQTTRSTFRKFLAQKVDSARHLIYHLGLSITSGRVESILKDFLSVPTNNAFINDNLDSEPETLPARMLVVDFLHEFELGVWKAIFKHLVRILYAAAPRGNLVAEIDLRYRQTPTFGRDTIRKFATNASEMKKLAARDFEDLLQCALPAFEGLLPEPHNRRLMKLLYRTAEWHALAKARMHTESTLQLLEVLTTEFGKLLRQFRDLTCTEFATVELPGEAAARVRRKVAQSKALTTSSTTDEAALTNADNAAPSTPAMVASHALAASRRTRELNLHVYKLHALGDYVRCIQMFGTTDSYSTQLGELSHRLVKMLYSRTNKKDAIKQIAKQVNRREVLRDRNTTASITEHVALANAPLTVRYAMSNSRRTSHNLYEFVHQRYNGHVDPAKKDFIPKLQDHLLGRLLGRPFEGDGYPDLTDNDRNHVRIVGNNIFSVQLLRVNYTTYDIRRAYDTINPRTHCYVMLESPETNPGAHPYWYAQVLGIFHAVVRHSGPQSRNPYEDHHMEFLWVRWLGSEPGYVSGRRFARLPKIGFVPESDPYAFGFLDPACVIRGSHLIPTFSAGKSSDLLNAQHTMARPAGMAEDWLNFYVDIFVDRDMFFRYLGGGIGHLACAINPDEDPADNENPEDALEDYNDQDNNVIDKSTATTSADTLGISEEDNDEDEDVDEDEEDWHEDEDDDDGGDDNNEDDDSSDDEDVGYGDL